MILRTGRKVGRTIYWQEGDEPSDDDPLVGVMDTPWLATLVVRAVNGRADVWDEGYHRGVRDEAGDMVRADNPYRDDPKDRP